MSQRKVLVTSALPYSNNRLHVGHIAGAYLPADIFVRYLRLKGAAVRFVCGSDDHGVPIKLSAAKEGKTPAELAEYYHEKQRRDFAALRINFDIYSSTSRNPYHSPTSQDFFVKLWEQGYLEKQSTRQFYDESQAMFLPDRYVKGTCGHCGTPEQNGDQCENCGKLLDVDSLQEARSIVSGRPAVIRETVHWFLDLSRCEEAVTTWLAQAQVREFTRTYVQGLIALGMRKRAMTRDLDWGIPVPLDDPEAAGKVLYVWFDAPIGYISNTKEFCAAQDGEAAAYAQWWKSQDTEIYHFIGEDNTIFHCVIWIAMLKAEGTFELPRGVIVNQFLNIQFPGQEEEKISKSRDAAVWIEDYLATGAEPDALRYYLTAIAPERARTLYKPEDLVQRNNTDLANTLGNFVNRILSFTHKYFGPVIPASPAELLNATDQQFRAELRRAHEQVGAQLEAYAFKNAQESIMEFCRACNKYVDEKAPWAQRKDNPAAAGATLAVALEAVHWLAVVLSPFLPDTATKIARMLGLDPAQLDWAAALRPGSAGSPLGQPEILFKKMGNCSPGIQLE